MNLVPLTVISGLNYSIYNTIRRYKNTLRTLGLLLFRRALIEKNFKNWWDCFLSNLPLNVILESSTSKNSFKNWMKCEQKYSIFLVYCLPFTIYCVLICKKKWGFMLSFPLCFFCFNLMTSLLSWPMESTLFTFVKPWSKSKPLSK